MSLYDKLGLLFLPLLFTSSILYVLYISHLDYKHKPEFYKYELEDDLSIICPNMKKFDYLPIGKAASLFFGETVYDVPIGTMLGPASSNSTNIDDRQLINRCYDHKERKYKVGCRIDILGTIYRSKHSNNCRLPIGNQQDLNRYIDYLVSYNQDIISRIENIVNHRFNSTYGKVRECPKKYKTHKWSPADIKFCLSTVSYKVMSMYRQIETRFGHYKQTYNSYGCKVFLVPVKNKTTQLMEGMCSLCSPSYDDVGINSRRCIRLSVPF